MTDDIVTRLRTVDRWSDVIGITTEAADEIERLRAHIERLAATHPLASVYTTAPADPTMWIHNEEARRG